MKTFKFPNRIKKFANVFHNNSFELYVVGGAVRDFYAGKAVKDYDFATNAAPEQVTALFHHTIPTGIEHGTVTVMFMGEGFEVTTFRSEGAYTNSRHPDEVNFIGSITDDLKRRDFTINALAVNTLTGELMDNHQGISDLKNKIIRAIGVPSERFSEDSLRMLRAFRFSAVLGFSIEEKTIAAIESCSSEIVHVSYERIQEELNKILAALYPSITLFAMETCGLLQYLLPELTDCIGVGAKGPDKIDTFSHLCRSCDGAPQSNVLVRWAALLHDIGKPDTEKYDFEKNKTIFHGHDELSADIADKILRRLKFSNQFRKEVIHLISNHMFNYTPDWSDAAVRRFISRVGTNSIHNLILLREADFYGATGTKPYRLMLPGLIERVNSMLIDNAVIKIADLAINGKILMESGIKKGPVLGTILKLLLEAVIDDPTLNTTETLLKIANKMYERYHLK
ncbi:MAG: HDIG domain-containing protein [Bacteroidetes bacterium]|nr:HDIG domain-containing protein [Bacteroidota bacterium]